MTSKGPQKKPGVIEVPALVVFLTYVVCWAAAAGMIFVIVPKIESEVVAVFMVGSALYLFTLPIAGTSPAEFIRAISPFGGDE